MKAFTFLGRGQLHKSTYVFDGREYETQFFAEAIVEFFSPESLCFFATESAAKAPVSDENTCERLKFLEELLRDRTKIVHIPIAEGANETELWEIFDIVVNNICDNEKVLFDITHGFRSLPFLTFLALAYVRNVRSNVKIERVIYGAYEAVERSNPKKPVFDLTPFVSLLYWDECCQCISKLWRCTSYRCIGLLKEILQIRLIICLMRCSQTVHLKHKRQPLNLMI